MDANGPNTDTNYNVSFYHGKSSKLLIMCGNCYQAKEREYLNNYEQRPKWQSIKTKKLPSLSTLKEVANCGKEMGDTEYFGNDGKFLCSMECVNIHNKKDTPKPTKICSVCGKGISNRQILGWNDEEYCSRECLEKGIPQKDKPQQQKPLKNNNKDNKVKEAASYGSNALMIYLGAPQNARRRSVTELKIPEFQRALIEYDVDIANVIVHGPYVVNLANAFREEIFDWSAGFLQKEFACMERIGLKTIVLHPGSAVDTPTNEALSQVAKGINLVLEESSTIRIALETMCGRGSE
ncbi:12916_t:CDS:2 [Entrophospora sp. SA101]|nr:12916_t:CDS:2 [Entrophospora sp. SA101]